MSVECPNCGVEFSEHRETAYRCEGCGWLRQVDDKWVPCPEPAKVTEPKPVEPISVPVPHEPVRTEPDEPELGNISHDSDRPKSNVRSYLGGLVTVTTEDEDEEKDD